MPMMMGNVCSNLADNRIDGCSGSALDYAYEVRCYWIVIRFILDYLTVIRAPQFAVCSNKGECAAFHATCKKVAACTFHPFYPVLLQESKNLMLLGSPTVERLPKIYKV